MNETILPDFCFQELQDGTGMIRLVQHGNGNYCIYKGRPISVFVDGFVSHFALLQLYSNHLVLHFRNIEVESNDGSHLESLDAHGPEERILKKCTRSLTAKRRQNIVPYSFPKF